MRLDEDISLPHNTPLLTHTHTCTEFQTENKDVWNLKCVRTRWGTRSPYVAWKKKKRGGNIWKVDATWSLHLIPIFFYHCTICTSKISVFRTIPASFHIQQHLTVSLIYHNHMSRYAITKISNASHIVQNPWTLWIGGARTNGVSGYSYRRSHTPISFSTANEPLPYHIQVTFSQK